MANIPSTAWPSKHGRAYFCQLVPDSNSFKWHSSTAHPPSVLDTKSHTYKPDLLSYKCKHTHTVTLCIQLSLSHPQAACEWSRLVFSRCSQPSHSSCGLRVWNVSLCHHPQTPPADASQTKLWTKKAIVQFLVVSSGAALYADNCRTTMCLRLSTHKGFSVT